MLVKLLNGDLGLFPFDSPNTFFAYDDMSKLTVKAIVKNWQQDKE